MARQRMKRHHTTLKDIAVLVSSFVALFAVFFCLLMFYAKLDLAVSLFIAACCALLVVLDI